MTYLPISGSFALATGSSKSRTIADHFGDFGNVLDYGATGNGTTDDTAAFNAALAAKSVVMVPPGKYLVGSVAMNQGNSLIGWGSMVYDDTGGTMTGSAYRPQLIAKSGAVEILRVDQPAYPSALRIEGLMLNGNGTGANGISDGADTIHIQNCTVVNCATGLGGHRTVGSNTGQAKILNCEFGTNSGNGIAGLVDCYVLGCDLSANGISGVSLGGGGATTLVGNRFEWNTSFGIDCYSGSSVVITGNWFDRNTGSCVNIAGGASYITVSGNVFRGNATGGGADINIGTCNNIVINGNSTNLLNTHPTNFISFGGTPTYITIVGNDALGQSAGHSSTGTLPTTGYVQTGNNWQT